jgi:hypothetical protein
MKAAWWPLYGATVGGAGIALYISAIQFLPAGLAAVSVVLFWASVSRVVREDVLFGAPRGRVSMLQVGAGLGMAAMWIAAFLHEGVTRTGVLRMTAASVAAQALPRSGAVALAWVSRPAAGGLELCARLRSGAAAVAVIIGLLAALMYGVRIGAALVIGAYLILRAARGWSYHRHEGINGGDVAYARMFVEAFTVLVATFAR